MKKGEHVKGDLCNHCGHGNLVYTGGMTGSFPPKFVCECRNCGHRKALEDIPVSEPQAPSPKPQSLDWHKVACLMDEIQVQMNDAWHNFGRVKMMLAEHGLKIRDKGQGGSENVNA